MSEISRADILKLAKLTKLQLSEAEIEEFKKELSEILKYVEKLQNVDVKGLSPTYQVTGLANVMRSDKLVDYGYDPEAMLKNASATEEDQLKVRRMIV